MPCATDSTVFCQPKRCAMLFSLRIPLHKEAITVLGPTTASMVSSAAARPVVLMVRMTASAWRARLAGTVAMVQGWPLMVTWSSMWREKRSSSITNSTAPGPRVFSIIEPYSRPTAPLPMIATFSIPMPDPFRPATHCHANYPQHYSAACQRLTWPRLFRTRRRNTIGHLKIKMRHLHNQNGPDQVAGPVSSTKSQVTEAQ